MPVATVYNFALIGGKAHPQLVIQHKGVDNRVYLQYRQLEPIPNLVRRGGPRFKVGNTVKLAVPPEEGTPTYKKLVGDRPRLFRKDEYAEYKNQHRKNRYRIGTVVATCENPGASGIPGVPPLPQVSGPPFRPPYVYLVKFSSPSGEDDIHWYKECQVYRYRLPSMTPQQQHEANMALFDGVFSNDDDDDDDPSDDNDPFASGAGPPPPKKQKRDGQLWQMQHAFGTLRF